MDILKFLPSPVSDTEISINLLALEVQRVFYFYETLIDIEPFLVYFTALLTKFIKSCLSLKGSVFI